MHYLLECFMSKDLIGTDDWMCDGYALTPEMRQDIVNHVAKMYASWKKKGFSWDWTNERGWSTVAPYSYGSVTDFFMERTGKRNPLDSWEMLDYRDDFFEWLGEYLIGKWGESIYTGKREYSDPDPAMTAWDRVDNWFDDLGLDDIEAWKAQRDATEVAPPGQCPQ
jgi:hypothetical protein